MRFGHPTTSKRCTPWAPRDAIVWPRTTWGSALTLLNRLPDGLHNLPPATLGAHNLL